MVNQLEAQGKVDSSDFQKLATDLTQRLLPSLERPDLDQHETLLGDWEVERKNLIQREQETRRKAQEEKQVRLAAKAALQQQA